MSKPAPQNPPLEGVTPFSDTLRRLEGGEFLEDCADALRELNAKLSEHSATHSKARGRLTVTLDITHEKGLVMVVADVSTKSPKAGRAGTALWLSPGNNLVGSDPRQMDLKPRAVVATEETPKAAAEPEKPRAAK